MSSETLVGYRLRHKMFIYKNTIGWLARCEDSIFPRGPFPTKEAALAFIGPLTESAELSPADRVRSFLETKEYVGDDLLADLILIAKSHFAWSKFVDVDLLVARYGDDKIKLSTDLLAVAEAYFDV